MKYLHAFSVAALAVGLGGCASMSSNYQSDAVYRDGSYYSPADAGYGDYYYAPEPRYDYYYDHSYFFGSPFYTFGGYCSMRYRYCPPFWYDPFLSFDGFGFYSPWYGWYDPIWYYGHRRHHHQPSNDDGDQGDTVAAQPPSDAIDDDSTDGRAAMPVRRRWSGSFPALSGPGTRFDRLGYPSVTSMRARRESDDELFSTPEPRVRHSESSRSSDEHESSAPVRSRRRGDARRGSLD
jgi:hypothetical protein